MPPVLQPVTVVQPFLGNRGGQQRPVLLAVDPCLQFFAQAALFQVKVPGFPHLQIGRSRDGRAGVDQVGRVQLLGAILALVTARQAVAAVRAGAGDVAIRQETAIVDGVDLFFADLFNQPVFVQLAREMLSQAVIPLAG